MCAENEDEDAEESGNTNGVSVSDENPKTPPSDDDAASEQPKTENGGTNSEHKTLKKPDKILPCPRCKSMDTKFCYYNNYNVNQPRHFCKSCQRYWTAGGTMRNVPVGAGRRKNKNSASHCRHITISEALHAARIDAPNAGFHNLKFKPNAATVLSFGPDSPLCESMASALNLAEKRVPNGYYKIDHHPSKNGERPDDPVQNQTGFPSPVPCIQGVPWPFPWNSAVPLPAIFPPGYPLPYYTAPLWNVPWLPVPSPAAAANQTTAAAAAAASSVRTSPLGKHSRSGELLSPKSSESSIVVPKTLRIDDPEEAAKSSIWSTLGIKYNSISREGLFKALQPKIDEKKGMGGASPLLQANPAALSRSLTFQETA